MTLSAEDLNKILAVFAGMDDEYVKLIREHHDYFLDETLTDQAKKEHREQTKAAITALKLDRLEKVKPVLAKIRAAYGDPEPETKEYSEMERLRLVTLWTATMPYATAEELRALHVEHGQNEDFLALLKAEFKKREKDAAVMKLKYEVETGPAANSVQLEVDRIEKSITFLLRNTYYPAHITNIDLNGFTGYKYRNVDSDLNAFPIEEGPTFRPVFRLKVLP